MAAMEAMPSPSTLHPVYREGVIALLVRGGVMGHVGVLQAGLYGVEDPLHVVKSAIGSKFWWSAPISGCCSRNACALDHQSARAAVRRGAPRVTIIPNAAGDKAALKLMSSAMTRSRLIRITEFGRREMAALRRELDHDCEAQVGLDPIRSTRVKSRPDPRSPDPPFRIPPHPPGLVRSLPIPVAHRAAPG
jgi:hypothetical protein